jgi:predicted regulator of Ras-like GTPase activity (Roadblock/LC7/MglB family)
MVDAITATYSIGMAGMRRSLDNLRREAKTVAHAVVDGNTADLAGAMARSQDEQRIAAANAEALRRADKARGSVIDILA